MELVRVTSDGRILHAHTSSNMSGSLLTPFVALPTRKYLHVGGISILAATL